MIPAKQYSGEFSIYKKTPFQPQIVTDAFFEALLTSVVSGADLTQYAEVGTGTSTPTAATETITTLGPRTGSRGSYSFSVSGGTIQESFLWTFPLGSIVGDITEAALFPVSVAGKASVASRIKDYFGNPIFVRVSALDSLQLAYRTTTVVNLADQTGTVVLNGVTHTYTLRPANWTTGISTQSNYFQFFGVPNLAAIAAYETQTLGSVTGVPAGTPSAGTVEAITAYVPNSKQRVLNFKFSQSQGNFPSKIGSIVLGANSGYQISFSPKIDKSSTNELNLSFPLNFGR